MNKCWAKVKFKNTEDSKKLIIAIFHNFDSSSRIKIRDMEATIEIAFREPPMEIISAIADCEVIELNLENCEKSESTQVEPKNNSEEEKDDFKSTKKLELQKKDNDKVANKGEMSEKENKTISISELEEIAKKATSFENFAELVTKWLGFEKREEIFKQLIIASANLDNISWKQLEKKLEDKNITFKSSDKIQVTRQVSKMLKGDNITILAFFNEVVKYKDYQFEKTEEANEEQVEEKAKNDNEDEKVPSKIEMEYIPKIAILEETLSSLDKAQPVEKRVKQVFETMGLSKLRPEEQEKVIKVASIAIKKKEMDIDSIIVEANIKEEDKNLELLTLSQFINNFVQEYGNGKKVKALDFLSDLQKVIVDESEIETCYRIPPYVG